MSSYKNTSVAINEIQLTGWNPRDFEPSDTLHGSIRKRGWLSDSRLVISSRPQSHPQPGLFLLCGHRRLATLQMMAETDADALARVLPDGKVPAVVHTGLTEAEEMRLMLDHSSELDREPLDVFGQYRAFKLAYLNGIYSDGKDATGKDSVRKIGEFLGFFDPKTGKVRQNYCQMMQRITRLPDCVESEYRILCSDKSKTRLRTANIAELDREYNADRKANEERHHPRFTALWESIVSPGDDADDAATVKRPSKRAVADAIPAIRSDAVATALRMAAGIEEFDPATVQALADDAADCQEFCQWFAETDPAGYAEYRQQFAAYAAEAAAEAAAAEAEETADDAADAAEDAA